MFKYALSFDTLVAVVVIIDNEYVKLYHLEKFARTIFNLYQNKI